MKFRKKIDDILIEKTRHFISLSCDNEIVSSVLASTKKNGTRFINIQKIVFTCARSPTMGINGQKESNE